MRRSRLWSVDMVCHTAKLDKLYNLFEWEPFFWYIVKKFHLIVINFISHNFLSFRFCLHLYYSRYSLLVKRIAQKTCSNFVCFYYALLCNVTNKYFGICAQCLCSWILENKSHYLCVANSIQKNPVLKEDWIFGADDEARTRYLHLGKVALYRMSYIRIFWCLRPESNQRHADFQSAALPTELQRRKMATRNGLEPSTSSVTG